MKILEHLIRLRHRVGPTKYFFGMLNMSIAVGTVLQLLIHGPDMPEAPLLFALNLGVGLWLLR